MRHLKMPTQTMRSFVLLFAFVASLSFSTLAQSSLTGTIRFTIDEVCPGAEVKLTGPQQFSVLSNSNGAYSFNELTVAGRYMLSVGFLGYETFYKEFEISDQQIQEAAIIVIDHVFEEDTEMDDIIVQGWGKSGKPLEEEIVSVDVVNTQLIESNAIINASDAIERVPGIVIVDGQISVRGGGGYAYGTGSRVTLVIDDVPILTPERNEILWDFVPLETTDQIEVVKGSSSVQYGSSALNGIVHARTRWPERNSKAQTRIRTFSTFYDKAYQEDYRSAQWWQTPDTGNSFQSFPHSVGFSYYNGKHYAKRNLDVVFGAFATTDQTHIVEEFNHRIRGSVRMRWTPEKFDRFNMQLSVLSMYRHRSNIFIWNGDSSEILKPLANYRVRYQYAMIDPVLTYYLGEKRNQKLQLISRFYLDKALNG
ncbi:MAG: TonB-dependent receptor plug domain-containing protein, partial [Bacteroidota bacterium]|nr:TonB-dependent receptor plug domain-containing protein [Bacteroidota bacterium]